MLLNITVMISAYTKVGDICYLPRMLAKIRLKASGQLPERYHAWYGKGMDARCADFFRISFEEIEARAIDEPADEAVLEWLVERGREINENDIELWNGFMMKRGWRDSMASMVKDDLTERGWAGRLEVVTLFDFYDADEERPPYDGLLE
jgi:gluconokinase